MSVNGFHPQIQMIQKSPLKTEPKQALLSFENLKDRRTLYSVKIHLQIVTLSGELHTRFVPSLF